MVTIHDYMNRCEASEVESAGHVRRISMVRSQDYKLGREEFEDTHANSDRPRRDAGTNAYRLKRDLGAGHGGRTG
jgi:hypothetical protein